MPSNFFTPTGWKPWYYAKNTVNGVQIPDASFPYSYAPSRGLWIQSLAINCLIPWLNSIDLFSAFMLVGGNSGGLSGAIGGLAVVADVMSISNNFQQFGIGRGAPAPQMGYCIGNKFKQQVYTTMLVINDGAGGVTVSDIGVELLQNYRFKRAYVDHGRVIKYTNTASEYTLTLDIEKTTPPPSGLSFFGDKINIVKDGSTNAPSNITVDILGIKNNWDFIISKPSHDIDGGDYYKLNNPFCIEDPYLLSGFWYGSENTISPPIPSSGLDLYVTSHNSPYQKGKFLGTYIWKTDPAPEQISNGASSNVSSQPTTGYSMDDANGYTWAFEGLGNSDGSVVYPNDIRYREVNLEFADESRSAVVFKDRLIASSSDYDDLINSNPSYLRLEIEKGGLNRRHNWYAPCLKGEYINVNGKLYLILNQVSFNIIDVSFLDIYGNTNLAPKTNQEYTITNQYAWFINEHYNRHTNSGNNTGVFKGSVSSISDKNKITIITDGDTYASKFKSHGLSFIDRYQNNVNLTLSLKKCFDKYEGWKLVTDQNTEYDIKSVNFDNAVDGLYVPYPISVEMVDSDVDIKVGARVYIAFGDTFETYGSSSKESGYFFSADFSPSLKYPQGFIISSDVLCMDGYFSSNPYKLSISSDDRIGFTDGYLFGLESNGSAQSDYSQTMFITVPSASFGTSAFFNNLRQEDWVAFEDPETGKITIRRGSSDFTDYPKKEMITVGNAHVVNESSNPIVLDAQYDMIRKIEIVFGNQEDNSMAVLFGIGNLSNTYGFYISGDGVLNLQLFSRQGIPYGNLASDKYSGYGHVVSPVYMYRPSYFHQLNPSSINVGVPTSSGQLYLMDENLSMANDINSVSVEYIHDNQTLSQTGYYDIINLKDGTVLLVYGIGQGAFNLSNTSTSEVILNNSTTNGSKWANPNSVMIMSTCNDKWFAPLSTNSLDQKQYPLMVLNSVDYLLTTYSFFKNSISVFIKCLDDQNVPYIGCYIISLSNITHTSFLCTTVSPSANFLYRSPMLPDTFINDPKKSWTDGASIISDGYSFDANKERNNGDMFLRIMGSATTNSQIINNIGNFGIISSSIFSDGSQVLFYDSDIGVKMIFSTNSGILWHESNIVFYKDVQGGFLIGDRLFAISPDGIEMKLTRLVDFGKAISIGLMYTGISKTNQEIQLQELFDVKGRILIGSGRIESQRLSGYITPAGIMKIFFYDQNNLLKCMESNNDGHQWKVANNF